LTEQIVFFGKKLAEFVTGSTRAQPRAAVVHLNLYVRQM
jgi:hypothetical protein